MVSIFILAVEKLIKVNIYKKYLFFLNYLHFCILEIVFCRIVEVWGCFEGKCSLVFLPEYEASP